METLSPFAFVTLVTLISGAGGTGLGGLIGALFKSESNRTISLLLAFAGGVMTAMVCFDLLAEAEEAAAKLKDVIVTVRAKAGANGRLFGSVTSQEIVDALREQHGVSIEKNRIVQAEPIKSFGSFEVKCKFGYGIDGTVQLLVIEK